MDQNSVGVGTYILAAMASGALWGIQIAMCLTVLIGTYALVSFIGKGIGSLFGKKE